jgi:hypothetical protein
LICVPGGTFTLGDPKVTTDQRYNVQVAPLVALGGSWIINEDAHMRSGFEFSQVDEVQRTRVTGFRCVR